jgi:hypothetical protein
VDCEEILDGSLPEGPLAHQPLWRGVNRTRGAVPCPVVTLGTLAGWLAGWVSTRTRPMAWPRRSGGASGVLYHSGVAAPIQDAGGGDPAGELVLVVGDETQLRSVAVIEARKGVRSRVWRCQPRS